MPGLIRIDVNNLGSSTFIRQKNMNFDSHPHAQWDSSRDQCSMEVDDEGLALASQRFCRTPGLDHNLQTNPSASSGFPNSWVEGRTPPAYALLRRRIIESQMIHVVGQQKRWFVPGIGYVKQDTQFFTSGRILSHIVLDLEKFERGPVATNTDVSSRRLLSGLVRRERCNELGLNCTIMRSGEKVRALEVLR